LSNPYFVPELSALNGKDHKVADFVLGTQQGKATLERVTNYSMFALPQFEKEGKRYLTIAIGCTGGRHRSVALGEALASKLNEDWDVVVRHRDLRENA
jgi:phosphocarrier protein HPr